MPEHGTAAADGFDGTDVDDTGFRRSASVWKLSGIIRKAVSLADVLPVKPIPPNTRPTIRIVTKEMDAVFFIFPSLSWAAVLRTPLMFAHSFSDKYNATR